MGWGEGVIIGCLQSSLKLWPLCCTEAYDLFDFCVSYNFCFVCCFCIFLFMLFHMYFCRPEKAESFYLLNHLCIREIICMMLVSHHCRCQDELFWIQRKLLISLCSRLFHIISNHQQGMSEMLKSLRLSFVYKKCPQISQHSSFSLIWSGSSLHHHHHHHLYPPYSNCSSSSGSGGSSSSSSSNSSSILFGMQHVLAAVQQRVKVVVVLVFFSDQICLC